EGASGGHGFRGVEGDIEEGLAELSGICLEGGEAGSEITDEFDLLLGEFVADEEGEIFNDAVDVDRGQDGIRSAGEVEDLLDDFIEVIDAFEDDGGILRAGVAGREIELEGVVEHFD